MKILITGASGQLGETVSQLAINRGFDVVALPKRVLDISDESSVMQVMLAQRPECVINCAAYTAVDRAEEERERCHAVNVIGPRCLAKGCTRIGAKLIHVSTEYVFDGSGDTPWETHDPTGAVNYYGETKALGEQEAMKGCRKTFLVRASWIYARRGDNYINTMLRLAEKYHEIKVVDDQIGAPTYAPDLAEFLLDLALTEKYGIYHAVNEGYCSRYELTKEIFRLIASDTRVIPIKSSEYPSRAARPLNCRLSTDSLEENGFHRFRGWKEALAEFFE